MMNTSNKKKKLLFRFHKCSIWKNRGYLHCYSWVRWMENSMWLGSLQCWPRKKSWIRSHFKDCARLKGMMAIIPTFVRFRHHRIFNPYTQPADTINASYDGKLRSKINLGTLTSWNTIEISKIFIRRSSQPNNLRNTVKEFCSLEIILMNQQSKTLLKTQTLNMNYP